MAVDRVDKLVKDHEKISKAINELSYADYSEFCTKIGRPLPDIEVARVEPPQTSPNLVLVSPDATARRAELSEFWRETEPDEEIGEVGEFMLYHTRPEWIKSGAKIPDSEVYIFEYLINGVITLQLGYDRSKMASLLEATLALNHMIQMYKDEPDGGWIKIELDPSNSWVRGDNYDRLIDSVIVVANKGTDHEWKGTPEDFVGSLRQNPKWINWFEWFDRWKEEWVNDLESVFTNMVSLRVAETIGSLFTELGTLIQNPTGIVSSDIYDQRTRFRTTMLRVQSPGRKQKVDPAERKRKLTSFVVHTNRLKTLAVYIHNFLEKPDNRLRPDWPTVLEGSFDYQDLCEKHDKEIVMSVARLTAKRWCDKTVSERRHNLLIMPLTIAREIAARELHLKQEDGNPYDPETLASMYTDGGGMRWKYQPPL